MSDYLVGRNRPPLDSRFKPGQSGNKQGRKKTSGAAHAINLLDAPIMVESSQGRRKIDPFAFATEKQFRLAMGGDMRAARDVVRKCKDAGVFDITDVEHEFFWIIPKEWIWGVWKAMWRKYGAPPWAGPLDGLVPIERRNGFGSANNTLGGNEQVEGDVIPLGRAKTPRDQKATVRKIANNRETITENGRTKRYSYLEIVILRIRNESIKGDPAAIKIAEQIRSSHVQPVNGVPKAVAFFPERFQSAEEWAFRCRPEGTAAMLEDFLKIGAGFYDDIISNLQPEELDYHAGKR